jgi:hypothetical protein
MKQFLSQEKLEEIQEIIEMKIVHRYRMIVCNKEDRTQAGSSTRRKIVHRWAYFQMAGRLFSDGKIVYKVGRSSTGVKIILQMSRSSTGREIKTDR